MYMYMCHTLTSDESGVGVFVHSNFVDDVSRLLGVAQRAECFFKMARRGTDRGEHRCLRIASNTLLQQPKKINKCYKTNIQMLSS